MGWEEFRIFAVLVKFRGRKYLTKSGSVRLYQVNLILLVL